jgi:hypothetical protein
VADPRRAAHDKMTYSDFVWFLLSEEDKKTNTAIGEQQCHNLLEDYNNEFFWSRILVPLFGFGWRRNH